MCLKGRRDNTDKPSGINHPASSPSPSSLLGGESDQMVHGHADNLTVLEKGREGREMSCHIKGSGEKVQSCFSRCSSNRFSPQLQHFSALNPKPFPCTLPKMASGLAHSQSEQTMSLQAQRAPLYLHGEDPEAAQKPEATESAALLPNKLEHLR